tara:strand:- start:25969 stop:26382 length:414 start_codon:yes stop_codon:yes gene_type:complete
MTGPADLPPAIACASLISGLYWDGKSLPKYTQIDSDYIPDTGSQTDARGDVVANSGRAQGLYKWIANELQTSRMADKPALAHEATHYLQSRNGQFPSPARINGIENQAYDVERRAPYECMTLFGGWNENRLSRHLKD